MKITSPDKIIIVFIFVINVLIQSWNINKSVDVFTDAGVYLYSAKLISEGFIPYRDFFLGNSALLIYLISFILKIINFNILAFNLTYILWFFSALMPIYFITLNFTSSRLASVLSIVLYSTFPELIQWDAHSFALRQASLPFLAYGLFFIFVKRKPAIAGLLLGLFSLSIPTNLLITPGLLISLIIGDFIFKNSLKQIIENYQQLIITFLLITFLGYLTMMVIPQSFDNIFGYQLQRPFAPFEYRLQLLKNDLGLNWPILILGLLGSFVVNKKIKLFGLFNLITILIVIFTGSSFYPHYITIFAVGLSISSGFLLSVIQPGNLRIVAAILIVLVLYLTSFNYLKYHLIDKQNPVFFQITKLLKNDQEPIFTFQPIYALYADKNLTFHYNAADMRYFRVIGKNLEEENYLRIIQNSKSILIEPFASAYLNQRVLNYIKRNFKKTYDDGINSIYVKI